MQYTLYAVCVSNSKCISRRNSSSQQPTVAAAACTTAGCTEIMGLHSRTHTGTLVQYIYINNISITYITYTEANAYINYGILIWVYACVCIIAAIRNELLVCVCVYCRYTYYCTPLRCIIKYYSSVLYNSNI